MRFPEVYVLRHGETVWNAENRMQGALNSPLTERGRTQALRQKSILKELNLDGFEFVCSPQGRAFQTAAIACAELAAHIRTDDRLREIGVGEWSGISRTDLMSQFDDVKDGPDGSLELYERAPNGEGFDALRIRCLEFLNDLAGPTVIVTHGITSRMIRTIILGLDRSGLETLPGGQGNVFHICDGTQTELT